jgi:hypothetical protein
VDAWKQKMKKRESPHPTVADPKEQRAGATGDDGVVRWVVRIPRRSSATRPPAAESLPSTVLERAQKQRNQNQKSRGRLDRAVLVMLGKGLEGCFDDIRKQEVPERFKLLLRQI